MDVTNENFECNFKNDIEVPITHAVPTTTLESLNQIRNELNTKLNEADNASKKRRYKRQVEQFEAAIKATKEGKAYDYGTLTVPPGFAAIPLDNGRPITHTSAASATTKSRPARQAPKPKPAEMTVHDFDEIELMKRLKSADPEEEELMRQLNASDGGKDSDGEDLLAQLEREVDDEADEHDDEIDLGDEHLNQQIRSITSDVIPKAKKTMNKKPEKEMEMPGGLFDMSSRKSTPSNRNSSASSQKPVASPGKSKLTTHNKDLELVTERQRLFKEAALKAKQDGNSKVALVYLKHAKGFEQMILAAQNGLPLDMSNLPVPPQMASKASAGSSPSKSTQKQIAQTSVDTNDIDDEINLSNDRGDVYARLEKDLREQIKIATANFKNFTSMGDVNNANKFNKIAHESIQDLASLRSNFAHNAPIPLYHYEKRSYQTVDCNADLTDNDMELQIIRAINLPLPSGFQEKDMSTYVKFEFPYPQDAVQSDKTAKQAATLNPVYDQTFKLQIHRKQQRFIRLMNRKDLKLEVYYKAGFLKGDKLLATCSVKLQELENNSTVHNAFPLLDGRRQIGGKLEVKLRVREPLLHKEVKDIEQRWLVIDKFVSNQAESSIQL